MSCIQAVSNSDYRILFNLFNFVFLLTISFLMSGNIFHYQNSFLLFFSRNFTQCCILSYFRRNRNL